MKKELDDNYKIIDTVLIKLKNIIDWYIWEISNEEKEKYTVLYNKIVLIKKITNLSKIKELWEYALLKIWNLELELLEKNKNNSHKLLLKETNDLLWQIWSKNRIVPKNEDIKYIIKDFYYTNIKDILKFKKDKNKENLLDKESYLYLKTLILLDKYKSRLDKNKKIILSKPSILFYPFWKNKETLNYLFLKNKVIKQNITLLKSRISWKKIKYTKITNNPGLYEVFNNFSVIIENIILWFIAIYSIVYIFILNISYYFDYKVFGVNFEGIYYSLTMVFLYYIFKFSVWIKSFLFNVVFFYFINIFFSINF
jgi:hypothetical protein